MKPAKALVVLTLMLIANTAFAGFDKDAVNDFIKRIVKDHSSLFIAEELKKENSNDVFELVNKKEKIMLRGNNGISIASALNYYLRNFLSLLNTVEWREHDPAGNITSGKIKIHKETPYQYR